MEQRNAIARCKRHGEAVRITVWVNRSGDRFTEARAGFDTLIDPYNVRATSCGCRNTLGVVEGVRDTSRRCTAVCRAAYGTTCRCECGGEDHGAAHSIEVLQALRA